MDIKTAVRQAWRETAEKERVKAEKTVKAELPVRKEDLAQSAAVEREAVNRGEEDDMYVAHDDPHVLAGMRGSARGEGNASTPNAVDEQSPGNHVRITPPAK